ncbi:MAG: hypothetical protein K6T29_04915, partial [Peptococcaceae bacterium]|nr:hypothetical protein [Peptococcaceae bacterium]
IVLAVARQPGAGGGAGGKGAAVEVEPVAVQVGRRAAAEPAGVEEGPPREAVAGLISTVASFYNLRPEQVKVVYR